MTALDNIQRLCLSIATILINTYRAPTELFIDGGVLLSQEGPTQGDPLAMPMYALATVPLIKQLTTSVKVTVNRLLIKYSWARSSDIFQLEWAGSLAETQ